jgi:YD repeat-containing protein
MKTVIPPSPNASAMVKYAEWPINLYTGLPNIELPIYQLQERDVAIPISLSYHAAGNKVGEIASWVGLGWTLNAGGAITRTIVGIPDETPDLGSFAESSNYTNPNDLCSNFTNLTLAKRHKVQSAKGNADSEQDIYTFNGLGKSFKFFIKADGTVVPTNYNKIKILTNIRQPNVLAGFITWTAIFEDGTKLEFGGSNDYQELTSDKKDYYGSSYIPTAWLLKKVTSVTGKIVTFTYTGFAVKQDIGASESDYLKYNIATVNQSLYSYCDLYSNQPNTQKLKRQVQQVVIKQLSSIESDLTKIEFELQATNRLDFLGTKALNKIKIYSKLSSKYIGVYKLNFDYSNAVSSVEFTGDYSPAESESYRKRLKLSSLEKQDDNGNVENKWVFGYNPLNLPSRTSFAADHWGFYNGKVQNNTFLPKFRYPLPANIMAFNRDAGFNAPVFNQGVSREGDGTFCEAEILKTITYPTGGVTNFVYEPNTIPVNEEQFTTATTQVQINLNSLSNPFTTVSSQTFVVTVPQAITLNMNAYISSGIFNDNPRARVSVDVYKQDGTETVGGAANLPGVSQSNVLTYLNINVPGTYILKISTNAVKTSFGNTDAIIASASLSYDQSQGMALINKCTGGLRLKKMTITDPVDPSKSTEKNFTYQNPLIINPIDIKNMYFSETEENTLENISTHDVGGVTYVDYKSCQNKIVTRNSQSKYSLGMVHGGTVGYGTVTTMYANGSSTGKTVSQFSNDQDGGMDVALIFPYPPTDSRENRRGLLLQQSDFSAGNTLVNESIFNYNFLNKGAVASFKAGVYRSYPIPPAADFSAATCNDAEGDCAIQKICYNTTSEQVNLVSKTEKSYDPSGQNPLITTTNYFYDNPDNTSPTRTETTNSKGETTKTISRTPLEKADINAAIPLTPSAAAAIDDMIAKNIINPVIEQEQYKNNSTLLNKTLTNYKISNNAFTVVDNVQVQKGLNPLETRVQFTNYDNYGNLLEQQKANDVKQSYLWGYNNQYPIAQAINAANNEIFFDSFEEGSGWDGSLTAYDQNFKHSGKASGRIDKGSNDELYSHSNKWLNISLTTPTKYKYSGWVYSNGPTVEIFFFMKRAGETGYFSYVDNVFTAATNKWVYLEKEYTVPADVTQLNMRVDNNGGGTVWFDDIRLHPAAAQMTTYTYDPLVGITSQCDANGRFTYYEYDAFQRLVVVRDQDNNVLKKICYNYAGQPENCTTPTYTNDQQQATFTSRAVCAAGLIAPSTTYTIPAGTFTSFVNKATANQLAINALATNGQGAADALPCLAPYNGWNKTTTAWNITLTNTAGTFNNTYSFYPGAAAALLANIPVGNYNISIVPMYAGSVTSPMQLLLNSNTYAGTSFSLTSVSVTAATTITLQNPAPSGPCSFTVASGYSSPTSSIANNGTSASGYFVFYPTSTMTPGNNYLVATVNGGCRPSAVRTFSTTGSGRTWTVTVYPSGEMYVQMAYGSASLSPNSTVSVTISYNL